jgi:hypothetical protein
MPHWYKGLKEKTAYKYIGDISPKEVANAAEMHYYI